MTEFDPLRMPLRGRWLIEASAGTGKTHAIGTLVLRALLGLVGEGEKARPLPLDRILVVTFTRAATMELRDRLRQRLVAARDAFDAQLAGTAPQDAMLGALVAASTDLAGDRRLLAAALAQLDEAAVFTIHGFCQRMLMESAFESGAVFDQAFVLDDQEYRRRAARDFWRREVYPLPADATTLLRARHGDPDALLQALADPLARPDLRLRGVPDPTLDPAAVRDQVIAALQAVQHRWRQDEVRAAIEGSRISKAAGTGGHRTLLSAFDRWAAAPSGLLAYADEEGQPHGIDRLLGHYARSTLFDARRQLKNGELPAIDGFLAAVDEALAAIEAFHAGFLAQALSAIRAGIEAGKREDRMIAPDDVLRHMRLALRGASAAVFAAHVRQRYPLAFIDEFQDTDPAQYEIFSSLYPLDAGDGAGTLIMIGDPKQAIYAFRGADIFAYLQARDALPAGARVQMDTNWRSSPDLLAALAALYGAAADPFAAEGIDFIPVRPRPGAAPGLWQRGGQAAAPLVFWHLPPEPSGTVARAAARDALADVAAREIRGLLDGGAMLGDRPVRPGDIAVLVNDRHEAECVRAALGRAGLASALQSRERVYDSPEAQDLRLVLDAVLEPRDERAVRAALATRLLSLPLGRLHRETMEDERLWGMHLERFGRYQALWRDQGVLVMLRTLLADYDVPRRLLAEPDGARRLTDLRHLGELLQDRSVEVGSMHRLLRGFVRELEAGQANDVAQLRLESDGELVRIVTVHASKGLEYEIVMLPFAIRSRPPRDAILHERIEGTWQAILDLRPDAQALAQAARETRAEELRLLYVALTRARHACFVGVANLREGQRKVSVLQDTALGHLLFDGRTAPVTDEALAEALAVRAAAPGIEVLPAGAAPADSVLAARPALGPFAQRVPFRGRIERDWSITSYSALVADGGDAALRPGAQDEGHGTEGPRAGQAAPEGSAARFPRGARPGSCLHALLETWPADPADEAEHVRRVLAQWGFAGSADAEPRAVRQWLQEVRATPLGMGVSLAGLVHAIPELEFHLPLEDVDTRQLRQLLGEHGHVDDPLARAHLRGMLRGFVDLVFEHEGAFWIVDYKSNWLGADAEAYDAAAMQAAVRLHRYDLQYLIYAVALKRLLRRRLPGVDVEPHFGGVLYLFLRGMDGSGRTGVFVDRPDPVLLDGIDRLFAGGPVAGGPVAGDSGPPSLIEGGRP
ncbi:MAG: exodeoxyribonuclease V subunit beta [Pseudomonadales bacterium]|jgi:exodeoxyribonuclease V beta subunit|nr:exodeoxyribonuclease V subunit beta [Pseudomonadales bacterium]